MSALQPAPKSLDPLELLHKVGLYLDHNPEIRPASQGLVNRVFMTSEFVVRISKNHQTNHPRECQIAQKMLELGVRTACPVAWDFDYSIWERLPGVTMQEWGKVERRFWDEVFADLEIVHRSQPTTEDPPTSWKAEFAASLEATRSVWSTEEYQRLFEIEHTPHPLERPVFVHGDLFPANLMVGPDGEYRGIIDWGCAGYWGLERELSRMEPESLELALERWGNALDLGLLYKQRIDLLLITTQYGRTDPARVREELAQLRKVTV